MTHTNGSGCCGLGMYLGMVAWLLVSSGLLWLTWNHVVAAMTKVKPGKYWQALLVVLTLCVFCGPRYYKGHCGKGGCEMSRCHHKENCEGDDCPYSKAARSEKAADKSDDAAKHHHD